MRLKFWPGHWKASHYLFSRAAWRIQAQLSFLHNVSPQVLLRRSVTAGSKQRKQTTDRYQALRGES